MEAEKVLINDLTAPIKSFRLYALEQIIREGKSVELLSALEARVPLEDDDECRVLLTHAISAVQGRISPEKAGSEKIEGSEFFQRFAEAPPEQKLALLSRIPQGLIAQLAPTVPDLLETESSPPVAAALVRTFGRKWPKERLDVLSNRLTSGSLSIRFAVLESLIQLSPKSIEKFLPKLLTSPEPRTRALAIRGLARIDPEEALAHLEALFLGSEKAQKTAAIQNSFFFPFDDIKRILFKFFANETDLELLERAGILAQINPNTEVPYKIWEIAEASPPPKAVVLKGILRSSLRLIEETRILGDLFPAYRQSLEAWIQKRSVKPPPAAEPKPTPKLEPTPAPVSPVSPRAETQEEKIALVRGLKTSDQDKGEKLLKELFQRIDQSNRLYPDLLKQALRLEITGFVQNALWGIGTNTPATVAAGLDYLSFASPDSAVPYLGKLGHQKDPEVFSAIFRFFSRHNPPQARSLIERLLKSSRTDEHQQALQALGTLDFVLTREVLTEFLEKTTDLGTMETGFQIFRQKADPDNLPLLYRLEKKLSPEFSTLARQCRLDTQRILQEAKRLPPGGQERLEKSLEEGFQKDQLRATTEPPAYSLKKLSPSGNSLAEMLSGWGERLGFLARTVAILAMLALAGAGAYLMTPTSVPVKTENVESGPVLPLPTEITGKITENQDTHILVELDSGKSVLVFARAPIFRQRPPGSSFRGTVVPYRVNPEGVILANLINEKTTFPEKK